MNMKKTYEAQALAIAMVVLVVSSIIGISVFSRVTKDTSLTIEEQASSEALEISDLLIDYLIQTPVEDVVSKYSQQTLTSEGLLRETNSGISNYLSNLGVVAFDALDFGFCDVNGTNGNEYYLKVQQADEDTFFEIRPGQVKSFVTENMDLSTCQISVKLSLRGENQTGFSISKIYKSQSGEIKEYELSDTQAYCFSDGAVCNNTNFIGDSWTKFTPDETLLLPLSEETEYLGTTYTLAELRIKAIGGTIAMSQILAGTCPEQGLNMIQIQAGANCNGVYRAKEILIPETKWSSTIFDYVIFNGEGSI